jgi:hypothetical protein
MAARTWMFFLFLCLTRVANRLWLFIGVEKWFFMSLCWERIMVRSWQTCSISSFSKLDMLVTFRDFLSPAAVVVHIPQVLLVFSLLIIWSLSSINSNQGI